MEPRVLSRSGPERPARLRFAARSSARPLDPRRYVYLVYEAILGCSMVPLKLQKSHSDTHSRKQFTFTFIRIEGEGARKPVWWRFSRCRIVVAAGNRRTRASGPARRIQAQIRSQQV